MPPELAVGQMVEFTISYEHGQMTAVATNVPLIDHFLEKVRLTRSLHTWINYAHDLKVFFTVLGLSLEHIDRHSCIRFMQQQEQAGCSSLTINRRLAAVSTLFSELHLFDPETFPRNPVSPVRGGRTPRTATLSLYRKQPVHLPDVIEQKDLEHFFGTLPTWRDRTLILLMWISCLRISEAVALRFQDIECSSRSIQIRHGKGNLDRVVYMDRYTFAALNKYLDEERRDRFADVDEIFVAFKGHARGCPLSVNALQHAIDYYAKRSGLSLHAHLFRHTGITQLVTQGMSEAAISQLVGHRHVDSLLPYLHLGDTYVATEFEKAQQVFSSVSVLHLPSIGGEQ
jgi:integrase/recombinase XerD